MHLAPLIIDLAIILAVAGVMSFIFHKIRQPVVLGYILAGVIVGPHTPPINLITDIPSIQTWAELGVIFLMFTLGLEFSFRKLSSVGVTATVAASLEVGFFLLVGFGIGKWLGWTSLESIFLGAMLSISSTTIIIKALEDLKLKSHRFASVIFGILIVEDLFAILLLVGLTTIATTETVSIYSLMAAAGNLTLVVGSWFITGYFLVPRLMTYIGKRGNNEMLTLVSIGLCLCLVVLAAHFGYSPALGAFIMGSVIAETEILRRIETLMEPLKDLFGAIFFVSIGMLIDPRIMWEYKGVILLLSLVTITGKIFSTSLGALVSGQSFKNSVQVGMGLAQIGEFSFIIASLGVALKATSSKLYPIGVAVSLVTTFTTPYLIKNSAAVAAGLEKRLPQRLRHLLDRYGLWCERQRSGAGKNKDIFVLVFKWLLNGIIVTLIFNVGLKYFAPRIGAGLPNAGLWALHLTWLVTFLLSSPFIWAMVFTSRRTYLRIRKERNLLKAVVVMSFPVLTSVWVATLSSKYFPLRYILPVTSLTLVIIYFSLYRRLESYYKWFERTFLETFKDSPAEDQGHHSLDGLAPWNSHLVNLEVHPNALLVNKNLLEAGLRKRFGINVVAIIRGLHTIIAPAPGELIFPKDRLVMLGTDEQLEMARPELEIPLKVESKLNHHASYRLQQVKTSSTSTIIGLTIRQAGLRERFHVMVVGIERDLQRIVNPDTDEVIRANDILWVVGENSMLEEMAREIRA
ncbi:MAG TPA: cation:proton antiporter [Bacteriovoracaceae bacterium]|nr:cation:proton antiporter [Bacteriovoracaceae bacterium]